MTNTPQKRFEEHALQRIASASNQNEQERRLALELLEARDALARIRDLTWNWQDHGDWRACAARACDIAQNATLRER
jgi:glucose-6-phosphate dehydrogenase assembly protein OpcA